VTAIVYSFNERSRRLHERLGFTLEGRLRRTAYTNGEHHDELYFGMMCEEFDAWDPKPHLYL
jgi:RimJ/RimL family protein N-acetyltransferase